MSSSGSPPHGRGTHHHDRTPRGERGLTPARAGNTSAPSDGSCKATAHPRTGGEHPLAGAEASALAGSPPHGRGTPTGWCRSVGSGRLTRARAGNTTPARPRPVSLSAHPRTGGEHDTMLLMPITADGSPPHGRGTLAAPPGSRAGPRLTPARAGNTSTNSRASTQTTGSPPHGRGTPAQAACDVLTFGLTPARAGNTCCLVSHCRPPWAHPRTGGEHQNSATTCSRRAGSPPHGRGTRRGAVGAQRAGGLTPARAGNTPRGATRAGRRWAHPRTGGEHLDSGVRHDPYEGSPPHGRGTQAEGPALRDHPGLTPARAGNTTGCASGCAARRAHPRTGGEHGKPMSVAVSMRGSPPHGRGTPRSTRTARTCSRLTPARAGNTTGAPPVLSAMRGSPPHGRGTLRVCRGRRSDAGLTPARAGEHYDTARRNVTRRGSPPHGRGTRERVADRARALGLTPARAGNTGTRPSGPECLGAHPRTGGEHGRGSSDDAVAAGLTPARAGNTSCRAAASISSWAHPRTGGEHEKLIALEGMPRGSPPHGRGTHRVAQAAEWTSGLTPARAGNTRPEATRRTSTRAHPRTGGEHACRAERRRNVDGSPPHGRGTPAHGRPGPATSRLTPARAGNTPRRSGGRVD